MGREIWKFEDSGRWVRGIRNGVTIVDSKNAKLMIESHREQDYYFLVEEILSDLLEVSAYTEESGYRGTRRFWHLRLDDELIENAAWTYDPKERRPDFKGYIAIAWEAMDHWFEEEEEIFLHPRNPYHRVDTIKSSRHVEVFVDGIKIADTNQPYLLFETRLPTRYYIPKEDVIDRYLFSSDYLTVCPYKGSANYYNVQINGEQFKNIIWYYPDPIPEAPKLKGTVSFWPEKDKRIQIVVDGEVQ